MTARVQVPARIARGDVIQVRLLIQHPMETGYQRDDTGNVIARTTIRTLKCRFGGQEVFSAELSSGVAANPYLQFPLRVTGPGTLAFTWIDDAGVEGTHNQPLEVTG